jgi:hypothetical protein
VTFDLASESIGAIVYYRDRDLPACEPMAVRILSVGVGVVCVTMLLDIAAPVSLEEAWLADPEELHFEKASFDQ